MLTKFEAKCTSQQQSFSLRQNVKKIARSRNRIEKIHKQQLTISRDYQKYEAFKKLTD